MRYPCLVVDHDDTVVNSTATVHYPCFVEYTGIYHPEVHYTLEEYIKYNFDPGVVAFFCDIIGMSRAETEREQIYWNDYVQHHVPQAYDGMRELLWRHKEQGGVLCVVSHSYTQNILRDYRENGLPEPDLVFGWESPASERKPSPYPLEQIMKSFGFSRSELLMLDDLKPGYDMAKSWISPPPAGRMTSRRSRASCAQIAINTSKRLPDFPTSLRRFDNENG